MAGHSSAPAAEDDGVGPRAAPSPTTSSSAAKVETVRRQMAGAMVLLSLNPTTVTGEGFS
jgi:hypothetical protein